MISKSFEALKGYIEAENYCGWDPFDGLNSRLFNNIPLLNKSKLARLLLIQFFKRSHINFRRIAFVEKGYNPKGLALFLSAYCTLYKQAPTGDTLDRIVYLADKIIEMRSVGWSGSCWGYNFDWQARAFFQPKYTPTVVATTYAARALLDAYDITKKDEYLEIALSSKDFILKDLNRTCDKNGNFCFSYSPLDHTQVINASLLGAQLISRIYLYTKEAKLHEIATKAITFCVLHQDINGSWTYGTLPYHNWVDSFHTGFNIESISEYQKAFNDSRFQDAIDRGLNYYIANFFTDIGQSKYTDKDLYPIDIHSTAQLVLTLSSVNKLDEVEDLVIRVMTHTIQNMQDKRGFFYYQCKKRIKNRIPYMRWAQAWMFYALAVYLVKGDMNT